MSLIQESLQGGTNHVLPAHDCALEYPLDLLRRCSCIKWIERDYISSESVESFSVDIEMPLVSGSNSSFNVLLRIGRLHKMDGTESSSRCEGYLVSRCFLTRNNLGMICCAELRHRSNRRHHFQDYLQIIQFRFTEVMGVPSFWYIIWNAPDCRNPLRFVGCS